MFPTAVFGVLLAITSTVATTHHASAQLPAGRYTWDAAAGDDMDRVATESLPKVKGILAKLFKGKAKARLRQVIVPAQWQRFTLVNDSLRLETDAFSGDQSLTVKPGTVRTGWVRHWPGGKIEKLNVQTVQDGSSIAFRYIAEDGERTDVYTIDASGTKLTQEVTLQSSQLSAPIHYRLVYRKERSAP